MSRRQLGTRALGACRGARLALAAAAVCGALPACIEEQRYAIENEAVAMTEATPVAFVNEDDDEIFIVTREFTLPVTPPKNSDLQRLAQQAEGLPFPRAPWLEHDDVEIELDYTLANLGDNQVLATVFLDGRNEFNLYTPGPEDFHQWERRFLLEPKQRVHGSVTELQMDEIAVDLATVVNGAPNSNQVVQFQSQSGRDERVRPYIPPRIPGLVGFTAGIMSNQATNLALEISVRVQDHGDRVPTRGERLWTLPDPTPFVPIVEEEE